MRERDGWKKASAPALGCRCQVSPCVLIVLGQTRPVLLLLPAQTASFSYFYIHPLTVWSTFHRQVIRATHTHTRRTRSLLCSKKKKKVVCSLRFPFILFSRFLLLDAYTLSTHTHTHMCVCWREREKKKTIHTRLVYRSVCHLDNTAHRGWISEIRERERACTSMTHHLFFFFFFFFSLYPHWLGGWVAAFKWSVFCFFFFLRCVHVFDGKEFFNSTLDEACKLAVTR